MCVFFVFKQKTAYEMCISDGSSDVCSSDLVPEKAFVRPKEEVHRPLDPKPLLVPDAAHGRARRQPQRHFGQQIAQVIGTARLLHRAPAQRSEERRVGKEGVSKCRARWSAYH